MVAPLAGSVDRNSPVILLATMSQPSLPSRGAWIEIAQAQTVTAAQLVAPLAGSVDRNIEEGGNNRT